MNFYLHLESKVMDIVYRNLSNRLGLSRPNLGHVVINGKKHPFPYDMVRLISVQDYEKCSIHTLSQMMRLRGISLAKSRNERCSRLREWDKRMINQTPYVNPDDPLPYNSFHSYKNRKEVYLYYVNWVKSPENGGGCPAPEAIFYGYLAYRLYNKEEFPSPSEFYDIVRCIEPVNVNYMNQEIFNKGIVVFSIYGKHKRKLYQNFVSQCQF